MSEKNGDFVVWFEINMGCWYEMIYGGVISFLCCCYICDLIGVDVVVMGIFYDGVVIYCSGCCLGLCVICVVFV